MNIRCFEDASNKQNFFHEFCTALTFRTKPLSTVGDRHMLVNSRKRKKTNKSFPTRPE